MPTERPPLPDAQARRDAIRERARNVLVDAGAGTGKTTLIIDRVVDMVAPAGPGVPSVPLDRLAVITFTRRAAGELRYRLRQKLLDVLRSAEGERAVRLRTALGVVDTVYVGTIHSFADRLLRLRPVEAAISPSYEIAEETEELVRAVFDRLLQGAETGRLAESLGRQDPGAVPVAEVEETVRTAHAAGLLMESQEYEHYVRAGLDLLVDGMIRARDVRCIPAPYEPDLDALRRVAAEVATALDVVRAPGRGGRWLRRVAACLREVAALDTVEAVFQRVHEVLGRKTKDLQKTRHFQGHKEGWDLYNRIYDEWRNELIDPLDRWMGTRIARMREVAAALYERVKEERGVLDQLDLLVKLRDLLRDDPAVRRQLQALFAHVFVDEFQDTDPLQCEIVFFLAEDGAGTADWRSVRLRPGNLTVVGDPQQSIYRFRRADIVMYAEAQRVLREQNALVVDLITNFRSRPRFIRFVNGQFGRLLGRAAVGEPRFQPETGRVRYADLAANPTTPDAGPAVHVVPLTSADGQPLLAADARALEAQAIARRIRWLVASRLQVRDPETGTERDVRYGDIAVLAHATTNLPLLLRALDALDVRYTAHGGKLFLSDPLVRRYLLGLCFVADRSDGVAEAALLRPPFFALDFLDLVSPKLAANGVGAERLEEARAIVRELRRERLARSPIETALDLIERTALGRVAATGPNGRQALDTLYEVAFQLGRRAAESGQDYDSVTHEMRAWVDDPIQIDPPDGDEPDTVRVMTIHQAKGLEFPVVVVWDGFAEANGRTSGFWTVARAGNGLALSMHQLEAEMPPGQSLLAFEKHVATAERQRLYYVAMTRARDLLVVPQPGPVGRAGQMLPTIMKDVDTSLIERAETYSPGAVPTWARSAEVPRREPVADPSIGERLEESARTFAEALAVSATPIAVPTAVTRAARVAPLDGDEDVDEPSGERIRKAEKSRYGTAFGSTVHRALELGLGGARGSVAEWVRSAAREHGLEEHLAEAAADVDRALAVVRSLGSTEVQVEYPVCMRGPNGTLLVGMIDLLVPRDGEILVLDFKTDAPPAPGITLAAYPEYRRQLELYVDALQATGFVGDRRMRTGLLFTGSGQVVWS